MTAREDTGPTVGVVIPAFDREALIERAVDSVLAQTRPPDEVIVVDDGSTDGTVARLARYGTALDVVSQANAGASAARNTGVARSTSGWVAFLDSDDHWMPDHLERLLDAVRRTYAAAVLYFDDTQIADADGGGTFFEVAGLRLVGSHEVAPPVVPWVMGSLQPMLLQSSLVRRDVYLRLGGLSTELPVRHDTHLFFRLGFAHPMCAVRGVGASLSADAGSEDRLTGAGGQRSASFWDESLWMYRDLLLEAPDRATRAALARRLAGTHLKVGARAARAGRPTVAAGHVGRALAGAPAEVARLVGRGVARRAAGRPRDDARIPRPA